MRGVSSESRGTLPPCGSLGPGGSLVPRESPASCEWLVLCASLPSRGPPTSRGSLSRIGRVTSARFPIPRQCRIRPHRHIDSASEVIDLLQLRQRRVGCHSQLRELSSLRHDLALE